MRMRSIVVAADYYLSDSGCHCSRNDSYKYYSRHMCPHFDKLENTILKEWWEKL